MDKQTANNKKLESALDYSIKLLESGATVEDCLRLYPNQRKDLQPLLEAAVCVKQSYPGYPELRPSKLYMKTGKAKFLSAIENGVPAIQETERADRAGAKLFDISAILKRAYLVSTAAAAAMVLMLGGLVHASSGSLPGSPLYGIKRASESVQVALTFDNNAKAQLHYEIAQKRIEEAKQVAKVGEKKTATDIIKDAENSLETAKQIAKVTPSASGNQLEGQLNKLDEKIKGEASEIKIALGASTAKTSESSASADNHATSTGTSTDKSDTKVALNKEGAEGKPGDNKDDKMKRNMTGTDTPATDKDKAIAAFKPFEVEAISVSGDVISPNGDNIKDSILVSVTGATTDRFSVALYRGATKIATLMEQREGSNLEFSWDGKDINGKKIMDGRYTLRVLSSLGQVAHRRAKVVVDTLGPAVDLVEPIDGVSTEVRKLRFVWEAVDGAQEYTLFLIPETSKSGNIVVTGLINSEYQLDYALAPGKWKWRVVATDEAGNAGSSLFGQFTIEEKNAPVSPGAFLPGETNS